MTILQCTIYFLLSDTTIDDAKYLDCLRHNITMIHNNVFMTESRSCYKSKLVKILLKTSNVLSVIIPICFDCSVIAVPLDKIIRLLTQ